MSFKERLFVNAANATVIGRLDRVVGYKHRGLGSIFVSHSVVRDRSDSLFDSLRTSAAFLESIIRYIRRDNIDIVTLDEALQRLESGASAPFVCFTFDDGYKDNLTVALPIFERYQAPFTVFVTSCMIDHTLRNWWSGLAEIIKTHDTVAVAETGERFSVRNLKEKLFAYNRLKSAAERGSLSEDGLAQLFRTYGIHLPEIVARDALTLGELRDLAASPLVQIGGHTTSHPHLSRLDEDKARQDISANKTWLEETLDRQIRYFAYPYGGSTSCGEREARLVEQAGFRAAVTTRIGNLFPQHLDQPFALPRLRLFSKQENLRLIRFQLQGAAGALLNRSGDPVVTM